MADTRQLWEMFKAGKYDVYLSTVTLEEVADCPEPKRSELRACPWDNACIESFHSLIKREWINRFRILDYSHAYRVVFE